MRRDVTRRARRGSLPFGLIARQWLRPLGTRTLLCTRKPSQAARSPDGADVIACTSVVALAARSNVVLQLFAAVSRSAGVSRWRSGYALQTSDAFSSLIMHLHLVPSPARRGSQLRFDAFTLLFGLLFCPTTCYQNVIQFNDDFWNVWPISFVHL